MLVSYEPMILFFLKNLRSTHDLESILWLTNCQSFSPLTIFLIVCHTLFSSRPCICDKIEVISHIYCCCPLSTLSILCMSRMG